MFPDIIAIAGVRIPSFATISSTTLGIGTDIIFWVPVYVPGRRSYDKVSVEVTTTGTDIRFALYDNNTSESKPENLLEESGIISVGSTGVKIFTFSSPRTLDPGIYWISLLCNTSGPIVRAVAAAECLMPIGVTSGSSLTATTHLRMLFTFGAYPDPADSGGTFFENVAAAPNLALGVEP